jgi:mannose/fructose/N-acetylgalactosamine-specific phosphotransferase system component IIC
MLMFDSHTVFAIAGTALFGGLIGLDRTAAGQFMISQPIVAGPLTGWALGDPVAGTVIGAVLELIWVLDMPVGTFVPANSTVSAVSATAIAALGSQTAAPLPVIGFCLLLTTVMAPVTMTADALVRKWNARWIAKAAAATGERAGRMLARAHLSGLTLFYLKSFVLYLLFLPAGLAALAVFGYMPDTVHRALSVFVKFLPLLGVALVARKLSMKTIDYFLLIGFFAAAVGQLLRAPAVIIIVATVLCGWLGARYYEIRR